MKKIVLFTMFICIIFNIIGCSANTTSNIGTNEDQNLEMNQEDIVKESNYIDDFINSYNEISDTPITDIIPFNPQDKDSGYYRTEYRLGAWDGSLGKNAKIGESIIDIVNYGSYGGRYKNNKLRIYVTSPSIESIIPIFKVSAKIMDENISEDDIQKVLEQVNQYGDVNGLSLGNHIGVGCILSRKDSYDMMLDIK